MSSKLPLSPFDVESFLKTLRPKAKVVDCLKKNIIFIQGETADSVFYTQKGTVKLTVTSDQGKEAVIAILNSGSFFGEECVGDQGLRMITASAIVDCRLLQIAKSAMVSALHQHHSFSDFFIAYLLSRNIHYEADLADKLFNSVEKRLARILLSLCRYGNNGPPKRLVPKISHETLAQMVGTTRPHVTAFMNKFRKLGFIEYSDGLEVHSSLINVVLHD
jgi:CRP-like cAMP-binding protein